MAMPELQEFCLVGGTALALRFGHRLSVDLDLFGSVEDFQRDIIIRALENEFGLDFVYEGGGAKWAIFGFIQNVKVDIVNYPHRTIRAIDVVDGIRLYSNEDIAAMKINAIFGRGKKKDFWDICELLQFFTVAEIIDVHKEKFPSQMLLISIPQALTYFSDAEESENPVSLKEQSWDNVKNFIKKRVREFLQ